jgi:uncharacterized membrane protein (Fun14 family)
MLLIYWHFSILIQLASVNVTSVPWNYVTGRGKFTNVKVDIHFNSVYHYLRCNSIMTFFIGYINNAVIKLLIYFNSNMTFPILIQLASVNVTSVPWNYVTGRGKFTNVKVDTINGYSQYFSFNSVYHYLMCNSIMTFFIGYINNAVIKLLIYFNSNMRIVEQIMNIIPKWVYGFIENCGAYKH